MPSPDRSPASNVNAVPHPIVVAYASAIGLIIKVVNDVVKLWVGVVEGYHTSC